MKKHLHTLDELLLCIIYYTLLLFTMTLVHFIYFAHDDIIDAMDFESIQVERNESTFITEYKEAVKNHALATPAKSSITTKEAFETVPYNNTYITYSNELEKHIAQTFIDRKQTLVINMYQEMEEGEGLTAFSQRMNETITKVQYQNPGIVADLSFDISVYETTNYDLLYHITYSTSQAIQEATIQEAKKIAQSIDPTLSTVAKIQAINDEIRSRATYKFTPNDQIAYGVLLEGEGVCASYTQAFKLIADELGIQTINRTVLLRGGNHIINMVQIEGTWYNLDVTNNDYNRYFLKSDATLLQHNFKLTRTSYWGGKQQPFTAKSNY